MGCKLCTHIAVYHMDNPLVATGIRTLVRCVIIRLPLFAVNATDSGILVIPCPLLQPAVHCAHRDLDTVLLQHSVQLIGGCWSIQLRQIIHNGNQRHSPSALDRFLPAQSACSHSSHSIPHRRQFCQGG